MLVTGALLGMDVRIAAPTGLWPSAEVRAIAGRDGQATGARITLTEDVAGAVHGADFLYTDVWVSMGEPAEEWDERIEQLLPYQVNTALCMADRQSGRSSSCTACPPSTTPRPRSAEQIFEKYGLEPSR